jgi:hypothetical protein
MERSEIISGVMTLSLLGLMLNGCVHSCSKHKDDPAWLANTPAAAYRGAEFFWHDDFAGVDWTQRINNDIATTIELMGASTTDHQIDNTKKQIEDFSKKIAAYPSDKKKLIQRGVDMFLIFQKHMATDLLHYVENLEDGQEFNLSDKTKALYDTLSNHYQFGGVDLLKRAIDTLAVQIKYSGEDDLSELEQRIRSHNTYDDTIYGNVYLKIFKEKFKG